MDGGEGICDCPMGADEGGGNCDKLGLAEAPTEELRGTVGGATGLTGVDDGVFCSAGFGTGGAKCIVPNF